MLVPVVCRNTAGDDFSLPLNPIPKGELSNVNDVAGEVSGSGELENPIAQVDELSSSWSDEDISLLNLFQIRIL